MNHKQRRAAFYTKVIKKWLREKTATILVIGGTEHDGRLLRELGHSNVTISNVQSALERNTSSASSMLAADAESLPMPPDTYDYVICHAVLHHCHSPHRALTEMYRVARKAVIIVEGRDSLLIRILAMLKLSQTYEWGAVLSNGGKAGGVKDTHVPNYVYRWTERELKKTISSYAPHAPHTYRFMYGTCPPPSANLTGAKRLFYGLASPLQLALQTVARRQQNLFAAKICKPNSSTERHPWLKVAGSDLEFNIEWAEAQVRRGG